MASTTDQIGLTVNPVLTLSVKDISGGTPAEGQIMAASATISGDPVDANVPITYQWQSSSNGA
jgi:hypothetical protein